MKDGREVIKALLEEEGMKQAELGRRIGKTNAGVHQMLNTRGINLPTFLECCSAIGYKVYVTKGICEGILMNGTEEEEAEQRAEIERLESEIAKLKKRVQGIKLKMG